MLQIDKLSRKTGDFLLHIEHLVLERGSYVVLLGPSGAGKTMLLELIAGLEKPDAGSIVLNGIDILSLPSGQRSIGMVFQKQWLFPHMTVAQNIAYGLRNKRLSSGQIETEVKKLAHETRCEHLLNRKADKLSGGEAQRVAIARALVLRPEILLLDEPLANLDAHLRVGISSLVRQLNRNGQSIIHVTHDFSEAISLASHAVVMQHGRIVQQGSPVEVFSRPANAFVAGFAGIRNFFHGTLDNPADEDSALMTFRAGELTMYLNRPDVVSETGHVHIAAGAITLSNEALSSSAVNQFIGIVSDIFDAPEGVEVVVDVKGTPFHVLITKQSVQRLNLTTAKEVYIQFKAGALRFEPD